MGKHTPGPWKYINAGGHSLDGPRPVIVPANSGHPDRIAILSGNGVANGNQDVINANARLIAAAPDLLAACEEIVNGCVCECRHVHDGSVTCAYCIARAALAKVEAQ